MEQPTQRVTARGDYGTHWLAVGDPTVRQMPDSALHRRVVDGSIDGSLVCFPGLQAMITDVLVRVSRLDGSEASLVARPTQPYAELWGERLVSRVRSVPPPRLQSHANGP